VLKYGSTGPDVVDLQNRLGIAADGKFGPGTRKAVEAFQKAHGLKKDGIVGPNTWAALDTGATAPS
jgi:peptidoglycan hydrolase-like protein with peptidoglycan-binding domain